MQFAPFLCATSFSVIPSLGVDFVGRLRGSIPDDSTAPNDSTQTTIRGVDAVYGVRVVSLFLTIQTVVGLQSAPPHSLWRRRLLQLVKAGKCRVGLSYVVGTVVFGWACLVAVEYSSRFINQFVPVSYKLLVRILYVDVFGVSSRYALTAASVS